MNPDDYIKDRLDRQIEWYNRKSDTNQHWFRWLRIVEITAAASIPLLIGYADAITEVQGDSFALFVQRVETLISKERTNWAQYIGAGSKPKDQR